MSLTSNSSPARLFVCPHNISLKEKASIVSEGLGLGCVVGGVQRPWQGQAKQRQWPHHPDPPVVTSHAWIPKMRGRCKQRWALSKRSSQSLGQEWTKTEEVLCQDCDREYQWNSHWGGREEARETEQHCRVQASRPRPTRRLDWDSARLLAVADG